MSVSAATHQRASGRRRSFPHIALAMLSALALVAVLVAVSVSNSSPETVGASARSAGVGSGRGIAARGYFRDPSTRALLALPGSTPTESTPGPGHK